MTADHNSPATGHLRYYEQHKISPVRYRVENLATHFERRDSLYRLLGLLPIAISGSRVLEVAPGSGQNSLYVASCQPLSYDLVEPNPAGLQDIKTAYAEFDHPHTIPRLHAQRFESFAADAPYDVVVCENWLGSLPHELALIRKLASLVAPGGVMVLTAVPISGFFPNVMRKLFALRLIDSELSFEANTARLVEAFGVHLATISDMTRSHRDWVQDCMLNPHYLSVALPLDTLVAAVGDELELLSTLPRFAVEWRWFKGLVGDRRRFNDEALADYQRNSHNFIDYRKTFPPRRETENQPIDAAVRNVHECALSWQAALAEDDTDRLHGLSHRISSELRVLETELAAVDPDLRNSIADVIKAWTAAKLDPAAVREMPAFGRLFGRETIHVSFTRPRR